MGSTAASGQHAPFQPISTHRPSTTKLSFLCEVGNGNNGVEPAVGDACGRRSPASEVARPLLGLLPLKRAMISNALHAFSQKRKEESMFKAQGLNNPSPYLIVDDAQTTLDFFKAVFNAGPDLVHRGRMAPLRMLKFVSMTPSLWLDSSKTVAVSMSMCLMSGAALSWPAKLAARRRRLCSLTSHHPGPPGQLRPPTDQLRSRLKSGSIGQDASLPQGVRIFS